MEKLCRPQGKSLWPQAQKAPTSPSAGALPPCSPRATKKRQYAVTPCIRGYLLLRLCTPGGSHHGSLWCSYRAQHSRGPGTRWWHLGTMAMQKILHFNTECIHSFEGNLSWHIGKGKIGLTSPFSPIHVSTPTSTHASGTPVQGLKIKIAGKYWFQTILSRKITFLSKKLDEIICFIWNFMVVMKIFFHPSPFSLLLHFASGKVSKGRETQGRK